MTYEESFLSTCDAQGWAPIEAIKQIFDDHGHRATDFSQEIANYTEYCRATNQDWQSGKAILEWLGY